MSLLTINTLLSLSAYTTHPMVIITSLISCTTMLAFNTFVFTKISLFSYMIMLVMLGGLIILFIYMASLAPNEPIYTKKIMQVIFMSILMTMMMLMFNFKLPYQINKSIEVNLLMNNIMLIILAATYLFMTLVAVVTITKISNGPLRSNF